MSDTDKYREGFIDAITQISGMIEKKFQKEMLMNRSFVKDVFSEMEEIRFRTYHAPLFERMSRDYDKK